MNIKKMIEVIDSQEMDADAFVSSLRNKITELYSQANVARYAAVLRDILILGAHLEFDLILKHFGAVPATKADARTQFQEIFKCLATRNTNKNWFLEFFSLFLGLGLALDLDMDAVEEAFFANEGR